MVANQNRKSQVGWRWLVSRWLPHVGSKWNNGSNCGSRSVNGNNVAANRNANNGARPASDTREIKRLSLIPWLDLQAMALCQNTLRENGGASRKSSKVPPLKAVVTHLFRRMSKMVGYPKYLNTKDDYEFVRKNFPKDMWQSAFESLLDTRRDWFNEGEITGTGITDETHKVIIDEQSGAKYQYVYKENPNCRMEQLGYTEDEIKTILG